MLARLAGAFITDYQLLIFSGKESSLLLSIYILVVLVPRRKPLAFFSLAILRPAPVPK